MKIGYTAINTPEERQKLFQAGVDRIVIRNRDLSELDAFHEALKDIRGHQLVIVNVSSIGQCLSIVSVFKSLQKIQEDNQSFHVLEQGLTKRIGDQEYLGLLINLGEVDLKAVRHRTQRGIEKAKLEGRILGRPKIDQEIASRIQYLYRSQKKTIREIAIACNVSIGTVHKYAKIV